MAESEDPYTSPYYTTLYERVKANPDALALMLEWREAQKSFPNDKDTQGNTLLHRFMQDVAAAYGRGEVIGSQDLSTIKQHFRTAGYDFNIANHAGQKPLDIIAHIATLHPPGTCILSEHRRQPAPDSLARPEPQGRINNVVPFTPTRPRF